MIIQSAQNTTGINDAMRKAIIDLWEQATSKTPWEAMAKNEKMQLLQEIAEIVSLETTKQYSQGQVLFRYTAPELKAFPLPALTYGYKIPDSNLIRINDKYIEDAAKSVRVAVHESTHHAQDMIKQNSLFIAKSSPEAQLMFYCMRSPTTYDCFGIKSDTQLYIQSATSVVNSKINEDIRNSFYLVQFVERQANEQSVAVCADLNIKTDPRIADIENALDILKNMYECTHLSDAEMCKLIDEAQLCVATQSKPSSPRVASMAYDIALLMADQSPNRDDKLIENYLSLDTKCEILTNNGIVNAQLFSLDDVGIFTIDDISALSQSMRNQNPHIMVGAICQYGADAAKLVDTKSFDQWYFSEDNRFSQSILSKVSEVLGPQYATVERSINIDGTILGPDDFAFNLLEEQPTYEEELNLDALDDKDDHQQQVDDLLSFIFGSEDHEEEPQDPGGDKR